MKDKIIPRSFGTHDGSFHADEVTACALLLMCDRIDWDKIHRSRDPVSLAQCEYVCDVGGVYDPKIKRFDHHQLEYQGPMSSAGMVLKYLEEEKALSKELYEHLRRTLVMGVDAHDNGIAPQESGYCFFSQVVSNFLPISYQASMKEMQQAFEEALSFVFHHVKRSKERFEYEQGCKKKVEKAMSDGKKVLHFAESIPWIDSFFSLGGKKHPAVFVVMPTGNHWKVRGIPPSLKERMKVRVPLPEKWAGLHDADLEKVTKIPGSIFCHKGRFISIWKTKEAALQALDLIFSNRVSL